MHIKPYMYVYSLIKAYLYIYIRDCQKELMKSQLKVIYTELHIIIHMYKCVCVYMNIRLDKQLIDAIECEFIKLIEVGFLCVHVSVCVYMQEDVVETVEETKLTRIDSTGMYVYIYLYRLYM